MRIGFLVICAAMMVIAGIVWGGRWPPGKRLADQGDDRLKLGSLKSTSAIWVCLVVSIVWKVDLMPSIWAQYALFVLSPLLLGIIGGRILRSRGGGDSADLPRRVS
jgi:hypothetical protein